MTITEFLLARIAEDEAAAKAASPGGWQFSGIASVAGGTLYDETRRIVDVVYERPDDHDGSIVRHLLSSEADANGLHIARHDPARVLAECEAKRRIMERHNAQPFFDDPESFYCATCNEGIGGFHPCPTLRALAAVYADHPDYDQAWSL